MELGAAHFELGGSKLEVKAPLSKLFARKGDLPTNNNGEPAVQARR